MLKLLLGHWKAQKKKPSLLPEEGDVHFEDPSTINPLFEDSDSSLSSIRRTEDSKPQGYNQTKSQEENEQNANSVPLVDDLVDVSTPPYEKDFNLTTPKEQIFIKEKDTSFLTKGENTRKSDDLEKEKASKKVESEVENLNPIISEIPLDVESPNNVSATGDTEIRDISGDENMRLYNQPSTSAIRENKKHSDIVSGNVQKSFLHSSKSTVKTLGNEENQQNKVLTYNLSNAGADQNRPVSNVLKQAKETLPPSQPKRSVNHTESPENLKTRAIDELIKKFQGSAKNREEVENVSKQQKEKPANHSTETEQVSNSVTKTDNNVVPSPSSENNKDSYQISKPETTDIPKTSKLITRTDVPNDNGQKIEALSNIFKFPPPPPLEYLENKSSLHGKIATDHKISNPLRKSIIANPLSTVNKGKENEGDRKETDPGKTRSDSSLDRNRTVSSNKPKNPAEKSDGDNEKKIVEDKIKEQSFKEATAQPSTSAAKSIYVKPAAETEEKETKIVSGTSVRSKNATKEGKSPKSEEVKAATESKQETKTVESITNAPQSNFSVKKETSSSNHKPETVSNFLHKNVVASSSNSSIPNGTKPMLQPHKLSLSKAASKSYTNNENENIKSHSEDSGITRGDQISSEATQDQDIAPDEPPQETKDAQNTSKKSKKEKKLKSVNKKVCKKCRHVHNDSLSIKRGQCDDYYDVLTGARHLHKNRHSDSWTSDISWEEKELLRRLHSRRGTVRSSTPSVRSRLSKHRFIDENYFRRHHNFRRSLSDESSFYGASLCSCDACWASYLKDYAYGRASLRGMSPIQVSCLINILLIEFLAQNKGVVIGHFMDNFWAVCFVRTNALFSSNFT